jgi:putative hemolysin
VFIKTLAVCLLLFCLAGCGAQNTDPTQTENNGTMPNPAAEKCVRDGYQLEPVSENGVPADYICVNPENGKKCEIWKYFREECHLR